MLRQNHQQRLHRLLALTLLTAAFALAQPSEPPDPGAPVPPPPVKPDQVFDLWPGTPPGETGDIGPEIMLVERRRPFFQITNVSEPTVSVFLPDPAKATGAAVMVLPGGGLVRLAIEHEGYEISKWLRDNGVAAFLVKYRVPPRGDDRRHFFKTGVQDAQRAISLVRSRAAEFKIDPNGIGAIGFSAGGEIGTWLSLFGPDERQYEPVDAADQQPTRPAFMLNIYPGGLAFGYGGQEPAVRQDILDHLNDQTPPMFFAHTFPDASMNSILMMAELRKRDIPAEIHVFQDGAHGFGVRKTGAPLGVWPELAMNWMRSLGFLDSRQVRDYADRLTKAFESNAASSRKSPPPASSRSTTPTAPRSASSAKPSPARKSWDTRAPPAPRPARRVSASTRRFIARSSKERFTRRRKPRRCRPTPLESSRPKSATSWESTSRPPSPTRTKPAPPPKPSSRPSKFPNQAPYSGQGS